MFSKISKIRFDLFGIRLLKLIYLIRFPKLLPFLFSAIMPGFEHLVAINKIKKVNSLVDCGSNKGQFALILFFKKKFKSYICFDPIVEPVKCNEFLIKNRVNVNYFPVALSNKVGKKSFYLANRTDSSSLKKIKNVASSYFSDLTFSKKLNVIVDKLVNYENQILNMPSPLALKIDVQGSELDLLIGADYLLTKFKYIFIEISYEGLYEDIGSSVDIFSELEGKGFKKFHVYNQLKRNRRVLSEDYLFINCKI